MSRDITRFARVRHAHNYVLIITPRLFVACNHGNVMGVVTRAPVMLACYITRMYYIGVIRHTPSRP